jgi:hypothetical protein
LEIGAHFELLFVPFHHFFRKSLELFVLGLELFELGLFGKELGVFLLAGFEGLENGHVLILVEGLLLLEGFLSDSGFHELNFLVLDLAFIVDQGLFHLHE